MSFDLSSLALKETFVLQLKHPVDGTPLFADKEMKKPVVVNLYGKASKQYQRAIEAMQTRALRRQAKKETIKPEELQKESLDMLKACSESATNLAVDGVDVKTADELRAVYADPRFSWLRDQVDEAIGDQSNFLTQ
jgi:DNA-directed RNA polymerase subunit F